MSVFQTSAGAPNPMRGALIAVLVVIAVSLSLDMIGDAAQGSSVVHLLLELVAAVAAAVGVGVIVSAWRREVALEREHRAAVAADLERARAEAEHWRGQAREALAGLGAAIERQFARWGLSPAESEVALLILKGLSYKEIADVRGTSERTVRQQAATVLQRSGLASRAELSAFFLEDLLLPTAQRDVDRPGAAR